MRADLSESQQRLHDSLFDLYEIGGLESMKSGTRGLPRDLIIDLETSVLTPEIGEIIHYRDVNLWDENDESDDWAKPLRPLSAEIERIVGVTNERLASYRSTDLMLGKFLALLDR